MRERALHRRHRNDRIRNTASPTRRSAACHDDLTPLDRTPEVRLAGPGVKGGRAIGATDEPGFKAVEDPCHVGDLHPTILHLMGLDQQRLTYFHEALDQRLTGGLDRRVIKKVPA